MTSTAAKSYTVPIHAEGHANRSGVQSEQIQPVRLSVKSNFTFSAPNEEKSQPGERRELRLQTDRLGVRWCIGLSIPALGVAQIAMESYVG